jgi:hypothetical protein
MREGAGWDSQQGAVASWREKPFFERMRTLDNLKAMYQLKQSCCQSVAYQFLPIGREMRDITAPVLPRWLILGEGS